MTPLLFTLLETYNNLKKYRVNVSKYIHQIRHFTENIILITALTFEIYKNINQKPKRMTT